MSLLLKDEYSGESGAYVGAYPSGYFYNEITEMCVALGLEPPERDDVHCTVVYSREKTLAALPKIKSPVNALITSVQHWVGHNGKTYIVADVQSMAMCALHSRFIRAGAEHSFAAYRPHVTLGKVAKPSPDLEERIEALNLRLKVDPLHLVFLSFKLNDINTDD